MKIALITASPAEKLTDRNGFSKIPPGGNDAYTRSEGWVAYIDYNDQRNHRVIRVDPGHSYQIGGELPKRQSFFEQWIRG
ncbi:hypothetical protein BGZ92_004338 [Podila epicladia]|nr:hypothetical protein BGZ92_004338 [Podila epicladia]